jgi:hypothetical protein
MKPFKNLNTIKDAAMSGDKTKLKTCFDHGFQVDTPFPELYNFGTPFLIQPWPISRLKLETKSFWHSLPCTRPPPSRKTSMATLLLYFSLHQNLAIIQKSEKLAVLTLDLLGTTAVNLQ